MSRCTHDMSSNEQEKSGFTLHMTGNGVEMRRDGLLMNGCTPQMFAGEQNMSRDRAEMDADSLNMDCDEVGMDRDLVGIKRDGVGVDRDGVGMDGNVLGILNASMKTPPLKQLETSRCRGKEAGSPLSRRCGRPTRR
jgi:hypothetical protein